MCNGLVLDVNINQSIIQKNFIPSLTPKASILIIFGKIQNKQR